MYILYYDSGTTNTRAYLLKDEKIINRKEQSIGAKDSALEGDNTTLIKELYNLYMDIAKESRITTADIEHIYLSGMISSASGITDIEHLSTPVDKKALKNNIKMYREDLFFKRILEIIPGIKTIERGIRVSIEEAGRINMMRGEEIEVFGILSEHSELTIGKHIVLMPGSHTQAVFIDNGVIVNISSNITGELFRAITKETILGASIDGEMEWIIDHQMVCYGGACVHQYGFNKALYMLRTMELFTGASLNQRRSYLEGILNVGLMDAIVQMLGTEWTKAHKHEIKLSIMGDEVQQEIFKAFCEDSYSNFQLSIIKQKQKKPYSVCGLLAILSNVT